MTIKPHNPVRAWDAFVAPTERVTLDDAIGRISASTIRQYPPGVPEVTPGMRYTSKIVKSLNAAHSKGVDIIGVKMDGDRLVSVLKDQDSEETALDITTYDAENIDNSTADEIADFFRDGFCSEPYFHFAFHESDPLQSLPPTLDFDAYTVSVALSDPCKKDICQDSLRDAAYQRAKANQESGRTKKTILPKGFHLWTDKEKCRSITKDRLSDPGYVTLVRNTADGKLMGLLHSRMGTLERLFHTEEWSDPLLFSQYEDIKYKDDPERFFDKVHYHFGLKPSDEIMTTSAQILKSDIQGGNVFYKMMRSMARHIKPEHAALPILSEIPPHGTAHALNTTLNERLVFGILKNGHPVVYCSQMSQALFLMVGEKKHWNYALRQAAKEQREYRTKFYISQPTDHQAVIVKPNGKLGLAAFARQNIPKGTRIAIFTGERYQSETALGLPEIMRDHAIQISANEFVFGYKGLAHRLCHSCDPNCGIRNLTEIFTIRDISAGEQLTWDYRCSENSNWVMKDCLCGSARCTGKVANFDSLPETMKSEYLSKSMVSEWIAESL